MSRHGSPRRSSKGIAEADTDFRRKRREFRDTYGPSSVEVLTWIDQGEEARFWMAAIVQSSDDAVIGKTLDCTITSWNWAAERLYGYAEFREAVRQLGLFLQLAEAPVQDTGENQ